MAQPSWIRAPPSFVRRHQTLLIGTLCLALASGLLASGLATSAVISESVQVPDLQKADPRCAAFAGLAQYQLELFGGVLTQRTIDASQGAHVLVVPDGQTNPTGHALAPTGSQFTYDDASGTTWTSVKYAYGDGTLAAWGVPIRNVAVDPELGPFNYLIVFDAVGLGGTQFDLYVDTDLSR